MKMIVWFVFVLGARSAAGDVFIAKVGQKVTLNCEVSSYTRSLVWRRGDDLLCSVDQRGFNRKGTIDLAKRSAVRNVNLEISGVRETDAGKFTCLADQTLREHSLAVVSVSAKPSTVLQPGNEATLQCNVKGLDEGHEVNWKSPNAGSLKQSSVQLKPVTSLHGGTWECVITYGSNQISESLTITVKEPLRTTKQPPSGTVKNNAETPCSSCTGKDASSGLLGLTWWVWVAIGVGCLVVILLMVCVIVLYMRVKRRRKKFRKINMAQQRQRSKKYCQCDHPTAAAKPKQGRRREKPSALPLHSV
ncbi:leukocyte immunoglobulin-like receptor subfamily B member 2 [Archocentrus centrarchus]|uniref:leukocyte immunoglobulin-like receptor subfamily B member 2 n=1 Tax=Archocentrus centrarchus TaxID=63155 RepID=UPI0011E9BDC1|nr:leukocyte immunoglobulin-like receptor subfamily B member 2 [Archocentrus centrarchus]XP_030606368.1 leukocyte immunoglobulin-like receptor subfamily B member 2 [Archocentrus centrarchus]